MVLAGTSISLPRRTASRHLRVQHEGAPKVRTSLLGPTPSHAQVPPPTAREEIRAAASSSPLQARAALAQDQLALQLYGPTLGAVNWAQKIASMCHGANLLHDLRQIVSRHRCGRPNPKNDPICESHDEGNQSCSHSYRRGATIGSYDPACDISEVTRHTRRRRIGRHSRHQTRRVVVDQVGCRALRRA